MRKARWSDWLVPAGLILLAFIPVGLAGHVLNV